MKSVYFSVVAVLFLSACSSSQDPCDNVADIAEQVKQCQALQRQIAQTKNQPVILGELERRYQTDCVEVRYYRDEHQTDYCKGSSKSRLEE